MDTIDKERIKESVRESYAKVAKAGGVSIKSSMAASCCGPSDTSANTNVAASCCGGPEVTPEQMSAVMGYSNEEIASVIEGANMGLGCGNPRAIASLQAGETVLDLGSGGGFDAFLAAQEVGETGHVIGVDMTPTMLSKARGNAEKGGFSQVEFRLGEIEHLPVADNSIDVIISNCVINLSPDKAQVFRDMHRVLKTGGRLAISDVVATTHLPESMRNDPYLHSACIGGAATIDELQALMQQAGFTDIDIQPKDESKEFISDWVPGKKVEDYVLSATIEAKKAS